MARRRFCGPRQPFCDESIVVERGASRGSGLSSNKTPFLTGKSAGVSNSEHSSRFRNGMIQSD
jgi:hypothetical protein